MWLWICVFPVILSACPWICSFQGKRPQGSQASAQALRVLFIYLFICSFVPYSPELQGEVPPPPPSLVLSLKPGLLLGCQALPCHLDLETPGWGKRGRATQPHSPRQRLSLFYMSVYSVCVYLCGGGCLLLSFF